MNRFGLSAGSSFPFGTMGGSVSVTLDVTNIPSHSHTIQPHGHTQDAHTHTFGTDIIGLSTRTASIGFAAGTGAPPAVLLDGVIQPATPIIHDSVVLTTDPFGGSSGATTPINTLPPYISRTRIIKT